MKRTLAEAALAVGGTLAGEDAAFGDVSTDTRTLEVGQLFVALRGPNFDAHMFLHEAARRAAAGAIVERMQSVGLPQIIVPDAQTALTALARAWRARFAQPLIGVAGSNGKTTVKEMTAAIMGQMGSCLATRGNLNNHIGVPLTLLRLDATHRSAVIEMGANRAGDVAELAVLARPGVGLVTNAGDEHLEGFGSLEGVARAEGEMFGALGGDATAVINADDAFLELWRDLAGARRTVTFGLSERADVTAHDVRRRVDANRGALEFTLKMRTGESRVGLQVLGRHNVVNALAAAAAANAAGASLEQCVRGLESVRAVRGRLDLKTAANGATIIDDTYNANPSSARVAIDVLADGGAHGWLVLGDMAELGQFAVASHSQIGRYAREHGVKRLYAMGSLTAHAVEAFGPGAEWFAGVDGLIERLEADLTPDVTLLVKGSRVNRLERVVDALTRSKFMKTA